MKNDRAEPFGKALDLLFAEDDRLLALAEMSGLDIFSFYNGADLRGLTITDQDLSGLNFYRADLRNAKIQGVKYDLGAFNGSLLSDDSVVTDDYELSLLETLTLVRRLGHSWFYLAFRPITLEAAIRETGRPYYEFSKLAGINLQTLRNARRGRAITRPTAKAILELLDELGALQLDRQAAFGLFGDQPLDERSWLRQPSTCLLDVGEEGGLVLMHEWIRRVFVDYARGGDGKVGPPRP